MQGTNIAGNLSVFSIIVLYIALLVQSALLVHSVLLYMYMCMYIWSCLLLEFLLLWCHNLRPLCFETTICLIIWKFVLKLTNPVYGKSMKMAKNLEASKFKLGPVVWLIWGLKHKVEQNKIKQNKALFQVCLNHNLCHTFCLQYISIYVVTLNPIILGYIL